MRTATRFIPAAVRDVVTSHPRLSGLWARVRGGQQERAIRREGRMYAERARAAGTPQELPVDILHQRLTERLRGRGINVTPKDQLHIVYVTALGEWEKLNIPSTLQQFGKLTPFYLKDRGFDDRAPDWISQRHRLDEALVQFIDDENRRQRVDVVVSYLSGWHVVPETIQRMNRLGVMTCNFSLDDRLWFAGPQWGGRPIGTIQLAPVFDLNLTNASDSVVKYLSEGGLAMFWPEGANPSHFRPRDVPFTHDVSFIGACYGQRPAYIDYLRRHGVQVATFGPRWPEGPVSPDQMVEIYSRTRINLGFSGIGYSMTENCLKGRDFEVPMAGGLYLTTWQPDLERVFVVGQEVMVYKSKADCLNQVRFLLSRPQLCEETRRAAMARARSEHTWEHRFRQIFEMAGLLAPAEDVFTSTAVGSSRQ